MTASPSSFDSPRPSIADVQRFAAGHLSKGARVGYTVLLVVSATVAVAIGSLWATEPSLPARTSAAFAVIVTMALTWVGFASWVLTRRRVLLGSDRVVAATIGIVFSGAAAAAMWSIGYWGGAGRPAYLGSVVNAVLCLVAVVIRIRARRHLAALTQRRAELEAARP